jgi:hypothetical protein
MVLIAIAAIFLLVIALISINTFERKTARAYSDTTRAGFAVEAGLAIALASLSEIASRDDSLVFRLEDPEQPTVPEEDRPLGYRDQPFTYGAVFRDDAWQAIPLFSGAVRTTLGNRELNADTLKSQLADYTSEARILGQVTSHTQQLPRARWVETPADPENPAGHRMRYAFWVEDLSGRIHGQAANTASNPNQRTTADLDLSTIFDPASETGATPQAFLEQRSQLRTAGSVRSILSEEPASRIEPNINYSGPHQSEVKKLIPHGFGYADAGLPALDLNHRVSTADLDGITGHIKRNLPEFNSRKGGFPATEDYVKTIAASMIDYADSDSDATVGAGYRGIDSTPFVNELFDRYEWVEGNPGAVAVKVETFVELWNPCQLEIRGEMVFTNQNRHKIRIPPGAEHEFSEVGFPARTLTIPPNGFVVIALGEHIHSFPEGSFMPATLSFVETEESNFILRWNGQVTDSARGGLQRTSGLLRAGNSQRKWKGNSSPAFDSSIGQAGDPRASYYIDTPVFANSYDTNSNWGGRALKQGIKQSQPAAPYAEVFISDWADGGSSSSPGVRPVGDARRPGPTQILNSDGSPYVGREYPPNQPDRAPAFISNIGRYDSLGELGNLFDPAQWNDVRSANPTANSKAGGGFSLAIGRPEFHAFDREGKRAAQLMDLFALGDTQPRHRINLNTAPREVLRSLLAGIELQADPMSPGASLKHTRKIGDIFSDIVISHRNQTPLRALSDLNLLRSNPHGPRDPERPEDAPFFGNSYFMENVPNTSSDPLVGWDDAGHEELLRNLIGLVTFQSKTFRIVVAGEVLDASGKTISRDAREFHYTITPERDAEGVIIPNGTLEFIKHYEKNL